MKKEYGITFQKKATPSGDLYYFAISTDINNAEIANHLSNCEVRITEIQIEDLQKVLHGIPVQEEWGEVRGSSLEIFPTEKAVQINYLNRRIPISDFLQLLQEWLAFIR